MVEHQCGRWRRHIPTPATQPARARLMLRPLHPRSDDLRPLPVSRIAARQPAAVAIQTTGSAAMNKSPDLFRFVQPLAASERVIRVKTTGWYTLLPDDHLRIGISRGVPRRFPAGFRYVPEAATRTLVQQRQHARLRSPLQGRGADAARSSQGHHLGIKVPEFDHEDLSQDDHPMMAPELRRRD